MDLDYAESICLLSNHVEQAQGALDHSGGRVCQGQNEQTSTQSCFIKDDLNTALVADSPNDSLGGNMDASVCRGLCKTSKQFDINSSVK